MCVRNDHRMVTTNIGKRTLKIIAGDGINQQQQGRMEKNPESNYIEVRAPFGAYDLCCSFDVLFDQFNAQCVQRDRKASDRPRVDQPNKMKNHTIIKVDRLIDLSTTIVWVLFVGASFRN